MRKQSKLETPGGSFDQLAAVAGPWTGRFRSKTSWERNCFSRKKPVETLRKPSEKFPTVFFLIFVPPFSTKNQRVLLCFIKLIMGNRHGPGVSSWQQTSDTNLGIARSSWCHIFDLPNQRKLTTQNKTKKNGFEWYYKSTWNLLPSPLGASLHILLAYSHGV